MDDTQESSPDITEKKSKIPLLIGFVLMLACGAGGYLAVMAGVIPGLSGGSSHEVHDTSDALPDIAFVALDPLIVSLPGAVQRHLRFSAQLEVASSHAKEVELLRPRVMDVLNGYLRAVDIAELEEPTALFRLRAQMLRRVQMVTGEGRVRDLLVIEFVLN